ncbi:MAG: hypothetical protein IPP25_04090 [Saprospiraceae bacterium]|nr:hypothetical protein [Candidatus Opimibacter skivensis]
MKNKLLILFACLSIGMMSCDLGNDPDIGGTATQAVAGEWFTTFQLLAEVIWTRLSIDHHIQYRC